MYKRNVHQAAGRMWIASWEVPYHPKFMSWTCSVHIGKYEIPMMPKKFPYGTFKGSEKVLRTIREP